MPIKVKLLGGRQTTIQVRIVRPFWQEFIMQELKSDVPLYDTF